MTGHRTETLDAELREETLTEFQRETVELFTHAAKALTLPKSVGQIYGLLFASQFPLSLSEVVSRLGISKGSASQGLRWLRDLGAVRSVYVPGDRRDRFTAETELRRLATGFLRNTAEPHLNNGNERLARLDAARSHLKPGAELEFAKTRITKLRRWHKFVHQTLPIILKVADRF